MSDFENKNKAKSTFDPNTAKPIDTPLVAKSDGFNFDPSTAKEEKKGVLGHLKDTGASLMSGLAGAAEATTVGLADLYTEGRVGKDIDHSGYYKLGEAQKHWSDQKTEIAKEQEKTRHNTDGIWNKTKYVLENPSQLTNAVAESLPYMLGGAALGRVSKIANPSVAGAVGEGAVMAGSQAESIRQQSDDELLNSGQEAVAAGTGVIGGSLGAFGGWVANKVFKVADVDTALQTGRLTREQIGEATSQVKAKDIPLSIIKGAFSESFLEELPQSISEQILQNLALDKPWHDGVEDAAVMGTLAGMAMGGAVSGVGKTGDWFVNRHNPTIQELSERQQQRQWDQEDNITQQRLQDYYNLRSQQEQEKNWNAHDDPKSLADLSHYINNQKGRFLNQPIEEMGNLGNRIGYHPDEVDLNHQLAVPKDVIQVSPNGEAWTSEQRHGIQQEKNDRRLRGENWVDVTPIPKKSEQLGINPNDGPMSSAAALAVDSGASPIAQLGYTEQQNTSNNTTPVDFQTQHESKVKDLYAQGMGENITLKNGEQVRLIQTVDEANGEGAYNLNAVNQDGEIVGSLGYFTVEDENGNRFNSQLHVDEQHRRNGIATAMYDYAEANGAKIPELDATAGVLRTEQGQAFREARNARQNGIEPKQKDVPEFNIDQKLENVDYSIDWHKENIELATNEYDKKRSQDAIKELQEERHDLVQKKDANLILGADGQNKWFGSQAKADAFIAKKELSNTHHVVQTENKRFEIQPIITEIQDHNLAANTSNQKGFQMEALDHGVLNVPLSKRGDIDQQIDQYKKEQAVIEKDQRDVRKIDHQKAQTVAKSLFNHLSKQHIEYYADRAKITVNAATKELKSMAHWQPNKAIKIYNALKEVQQKSQSELSVPSEITELEQQFNAIKGNSVKQAIEKSKIKKQIDQLKSQHTEITTTPFGSEQIQKQYGDTVESVMSDIEILGDDFTIDLHDNKKKTNALNNPNYNAVQKADGSVEIVGMKHPTTGEWIGQEPASQQDLQDSAENIRAEKIRQKDIADMHNSVYGLATDEQLQESLKHLNKEIKKAQRQSENEVVNGKRSTRKAVASGALDRFLKNRVDLETYIKARKNGELKQRTKNIKDFSRKIAEQTQVNVIIQSDSEIGQNGVKRLDNIFTEISTNQFKEKENDRFTSRSKSQQQSRDRSDHLPTSDTRAKNSNGITAEASDGTSSARPNSDPRTQEDSTRTSQSDISDGSYFHHRQRSILQDSERGRGQALAGVSEKNQRLNSTFGVFNLSRAVKHIISLFNHLKMTATQDASSSGRINLSLNDRIRVSKVGDMNTNGFSVQVISSFSDLPKVIQDKATYQNENGETQNYDVSGVWHDGTLYVVADQVYGDSNKQLTTFDAYEELLAHEIVGHFGVQQIFGREYKTKLQQLFNALGGLEGIRKIAKDNGVNMQQFESAYIEPYIQGVKDEIYTESDVQQALVGELFAFVAQNAEKKPFVRQKLKEVLGYIRQWFRDRGFDKFLSRYNDADLMMFLAEARKAVVDQRYFGKYKDQKIETKQDSNIPQYNRNIKPTTPIAIQSDSEIGQTHFIPSHLMDSVNKLGDVVDDLALMRTEGVEYDHDYAVQLLNKIATLNPNIEVIFTRNPKLATGLSEGGYYLFSQDGTEKIYIYPQGNWESDILSLVNHELVHAVTYQAIAQNKVTKDDLNFLKKMSETLRNWMFKNPMALDEWIEYRFDYGINDQYHNELIAVFTAESDVRQSFSSLQEQLFNESKEQATNFAGTQKNDHAEFQQTPSRDPASTERSSSASRESAENRASQSERQDNSNRTRETRTQVHFLDEFDDIVQRIMALNHEQHKQNRNAEKNKDKPLYSRQSASNSGSTTQQVHDVLVDRFGKDTINELERQGKLEIIQDYQVQGVEGFYHNGKAVLVASNLTAESIVPTFLHELGGHAGFQNMMNQKQYNELMRQFDKLVEQRHPVALAAKLLAEREQGSERQQLEYLPYLLTLSATMQQRNVIQRNALQKLINNIVSFVKAWVFDQFGINLNLKPDDMLALSERMIQKNSAAIQSKEQQNPSAVFSEKTKSVFTDAFTIAKDEQQRIAKEIDDLLSTLKSLPDPVKMKMPPVLLALDGVNGLSVQDLPLHLDRQTIRKMMGRVDGKQDAGHQLTLDQVKQLINEITNPVMVFKDGANGVVVITEMKDRQGNPVLSAIHLNKKWRGYEINDIATAFSKDSTPHIWFNKNQNNIVYLNQEKSQVFARSSSHQLRGAVQNILASNKSSKYPTLPHFLGQLETTHVGVVGTRTFDESPALVRSVPTQLRKMVHQNKTSNQTILSPEDVVNFVEQSNSSLYSRQSPQKMMDDLAQNIKNMSVKSIKDKTGYKFTDWLGIGLSALGRRQLTEIYSKLLPQLNKYNELAAQMDADKNDAGAEADGIVREWANLKDENELADLMHDATLAKIDPAQPYVSGDNRIKYQQLRQNFNALSPEAQVMYIKARDAYRKHYAKVQSAIKDRILRAALSSQKKADLIKQMDDQFYGYIKGVYFPLARFGKYVVVVRNQNGDVESVSRAETMGEAQKIRSEMLTKFPQWKVEPVIQDKAFRSAHDAVGRGFMSNLFDEVANLGLSSAEQASFEDTLNQLYLSSMPDLSWAKHGIHRKGTAGFSQDARRAFAQNMFSGANYLAKLRYGDQLADQLDAMQKHADDQIKQNHQYNQSTAQSVIDEMNKRHENLMNPKGHPLSSALTSLGFIYYLGLSPATAMVNLSQTALVAYPLMGAKWDFDKAGKELLKASNDFRKGLEFHKVKWQGTKTDLYKAVSSDISKFLNKDEQAAYQKAVDSGVIDVTQAHDLAGIAQGEDSGVMWKTRPIMRAASVMFHSAERFNREVTFIAAYRLARQSGAHHDLAFDQAVDVTYKGHFDYSSGNRPRIMQGNVAKVLLLFKQFGQNMLYTLARQTYQSIKGETDAEKKEARRAISAILAMHATFAGALGLPGVWFIMAIASAWGGDDDEPWDAEIALRNYLAEAFNPTISNLLMKGAPRGVGIDVSSRVGINNLLLPDVQEGLEGKRWAESAMAGV
ncbi:GNAT family N-acetyltransferase [Acinetobacter sp. R933-2]|uniref:GNAT family N-acetyltransferase n=1 Tax=Acinetobacter sp. R933-2 TaxID=2746728 RepID=UPI0025789484|nr:GNAT family N-acetyltransferase [Acinetobacter sp. R933-2]